MSEVTVESSVPTLSFDVWVIVYQYLDDLTAARTREVCRNWRQISDSSTSTAVLFDTDKLSRYVRLSNQRNYLQEIIFHDNRGNVIEMLKQAAAATGVSEVFLQSTNLHPFFPKLKVVTCKNFDASFIKSCLSLMPSGLEDLRLHGVKFGSRCDPASILASIACFTRLLRLTFVGSHVVERHRQVFASGLLGLIKKLPLLEFVDFSSNRIYSEDMQTLADFDPISSCSRLHTLLLWDTELDTSALIHLAKFPSLKKIGIRYCYNIEVSQARAAFKAIKRDDIEVEAGVAQSEKYYDISQILTRQHLKWLY